MFASYPIYTCTRANHELFIGLSYIIAVAGSIVFLKKLDR